MEKSRILRESRMALLTRLKDDREAYMDTVKRLLDQRESSPEYAYWLTGEDDDQSESYCFECLKLQKPEARDLEYGGGWDMEEDGSECCSNCGVLLQYTLTNYGVDYEMDYFIVSSFDWDNPQECYMMGRVAYGLSTDKQKRQLVKIVQKSRNCPEIAYEVY